MSSLYYLPGKPGECPVTMKSMHERQTVKSWKVHGFPKVPHCKDKEHNLKRNILQVTRLLIDHILYYVQMETMICVRDIYML